MSTHPVMKLAEALERRAAENPQAKMTLTGQQYLEILKIVRADGYTKGMQNERAHNDRNMATNPLMMQARKVGDALDRSRNP